VTDESEVGDFFTIDQIEALQSAPPEIVIANHLFHLLELAAIHLSATPPNLVEARVVIDAVAAVVSALGDRLGEPAPLVAEGLTAIQLAYVSASSATSTT
jgi:hypothetical protein